MASDVYAFGMCCFEMVNFTVPNFGHPPLRFAEMACRGHRPALSPTVPPEWVALISQVNRFFERDVMFFKSFLCFQAWSASPQARPSFAELLNRVEAMPVRKDPPSSKGEDQTLAQSGDHWNRLVGSDGYVNQ
jgi:hypothetical protein